MKQVLSNIKQKGFSIIELVVVLALFLIIMDVMVNLFLSMLHQQKRALAEQELSNQTSYAMQYMSRALMVAAQAKTASDVSCLGAAGNIYVLTHPNTDSTKPYNGIKFINYLEGGICEEIYLDSSDPANPHLKVTKDGGVTSLSLLSDSFTIKYANFVLNGDKTVISASDNDAIQSRVTMLLDVKTQIPGNSQEKIIETTVTNRETHKKS